MRTILLLLGVSVAGIALFALVAVLAAIPLYFLWNWLMPEIFGLKQLTFWQSWGMVWLVAILFKSNSTSTKD